MLKIAAQSKVQEMTKKKATTNMILAQPKPKIHSLDLISRSKQMNPKQVQRPQPFQQQGSTTVKKKKNFPKKKINFNFNFPFDLLIDAYDVTRNVESKGLPLRLFSCCFCYLLFFFFI